MSNLSDYEVEQILYKMKINRNSREVKKYVDELDLKDDEIQVKSFDELLWEIQRNSDLYKEDKASVDELEGNDVLVKGEDENGVSRKLLMEVYEAKDVAESRKEEPYRTEGKLMSDDKSTVLAEYSVVTFMDPEKGPVSVVVDKTGKDVGTVTYDQEGNPTFEMADDLKVQISGILDSTNMRAFINPKVINDEFFYKDMRSFVKSIEDGQFDPQKLREAQKDPVKYEQLQKEYAQRGISAQNIENKDFTEKDEELAVMLSPDEKRKIQEQEKEVLTKTRENDTKVTEEDEDREENNKSIPEDKKSEIANVCDNLNLDYGNIRAVLIIKDPSTLSDCTRNSHIKRNGNEVIVLQFADAAGNEQYTLIQDGQELGGAQHDDAFYNLIQPLKRTSGTVKRVEDDKTLLDYTDPNGKTQQMQLKRFPMDMSLDEKEQFKEKLEKDMAELEAEKLKDPVDLQRVDELEFIVFQDFVDAGLVPPEEIQEAGIEEQVDEDKEAEEAEKAAQAEKEREEEDEEWEAHMRRVRGNN